MKKTIPVATLLFCSVALFSDARQSLAQTPVSQVSADWQSFGWTLPESFSPDQLALFKGLQAASGTWSFKAEAVDGHLKTTLEGNLEITGGEPGGMASTWELTWSWPAETPEHAIVENIVAVPDNKNQKFSLMLARFGPVKYSEAQLQETPKVTPTIFEGKWDVESRTVHWTRLGLPGKQATKEATREDRPAASLDMTVSPDGRLSIHKSQNLPNGQISTGGAIARMGQAAKEPGKPEFLTGMHQFQKGTEISDPRILRYLPKEATDIRLISDRNGHMAHYRISAKAFDTFLEEVWENYQRELASQPNSWERYSKDHIMGALRGAPVGPYEPRVRSTEIVFDPPIVWEPLKNATRYKGPRKRSAAGATYYLDRETGIACHDAGYW